MTSRTSMTAVPGINMRLLGLGVCCVWMNIPRRCSAALKPVERSQAPLVLAKCHVTSSL